MDGRLSNINYEEFQKLAVDLSERSNVLGDAWELRTAQSRSSRQAQQYLVKKCTQTVNWGGGEKPAGREDELSRLAGDTSGLSEDADVAYLDRSSCKDCLVHVEYHVVHSVSYQVPVFYFNATFSNGQTLSLEEVWGLLSANFVTQDTNKWGLVTQQEHPYLGRPFYHIHPCHTATVMGKAMQCFGVGKEEGETSGGGETGGNYLVTWLSTFAPVIGLEFSMKYVQWE